jgi:cardiolipin synthase A/B
MYTDFLFYSSSLLVLAHVLAVLALSVRVIMKRPATGVALAWLLLISAFPLFGPFVYLLIGERRVGGGRIRRIEALRTDYRELNDRSLSSGLTQVDWEKHSPSIRGMNELGVNMIGSPTVHGSSLQMFNNARDILHSIARDIDSARRSVLMEFYIWSEGGLADEVLEAVIRAAKRGVSCRLLIDSLGARPWWGGSQPGQLRAAGVDVRAALPVGIFNSIVGRTDLRLHRKIVVIDGVTAWTGSMNLVDPSFFKQGAGVGEWVDAMVRVKGSAVVPLAATMIGDWLIESSDSLEDVIASADLRLVEPEGTADVQVVGSGPGQTSDGLLQMILALIQSARSELILTTPYLVPDESLLWALRGAAGRGVKVRIIVPEKVDSFLTRHASRSYYDDLLELGVEIYLYQVGLLHTKSIMVDDKISMFGTVNLDMRSLWLNYEVALFVYQCEFALELRLLQQSYIAESQQIDPVAWGKRPFSQRFLENSLRLLSPLL